MSRHSSRALHSQPAGERQLRPPRRVVRRHDGPRRARRDDVDVGEEPGGFLPGPQRDRRRQVLYAGIFPNLLLSLHPDYATTHRIEPRSPGTSLVECQWLFTGDTVARSIPIPPTQSTSGTSRTLRTGTPARRPARARRLRSAPLQAEGRLSSMPGPIDAAVSRPLPLGDHRSRKALDTRRRSATSPSDVFAITVQAMSRFGSRTSARTRRRRTLNIHDVEVARQPEPRPHPLPRSSGNVTPRSATPRVRRAIFPETRPRTRAGWRRRSRRSRHRRCPARAGARSVGLLRRDIR